ncbi:hypothetical protein ACLOJK_009115 [Asimina triloba]
MNSLSSAEASRRVTEMRAVVKIRKKTKLPLVEDQWDSIVRGNGKVSGFIIRLVSEDIDPGMYVCSSKHGNPSMLRFCYVAHPFLLLLN